MLSRWPRQDVFHHRFSLQGFTHLLARRIILGLWIIPKIQDS